MVNYVVPEKNKKWALLGSMKQRCYDANVQKKVPYYKGCVICEEWLLSSEDFYEWVDEHYYLIKGMSTRAIQIDKDIRVPGNKIYAPTTCMFVPARMNTMVTSFETSLNLGRDLPTGVGRQKDGRYRVNLAVDKKVKGFCNIETVEEAFDIYKECKKKEFQKVADTYEDVVPAEVTEAFLQWIAIIDSLTVDNYDKILEKREPENTYVLIQNKGEVIYKRPTCKAM